MVAEADEARLTSQHDKALRFSAKLRAPFAVLGIVSDGKSLLSVRYLPRTERAQAATDALAARAVRELERYLDDPAWKFTLPIGVRGTPFQRRVWDAIAAIPVGESRTYAEIARTVQSSARAVGGACGANRIALVIPCHRVVGSRGVLGGFMNAAEGESVDIKRWLLTHEGYRFGA
jgi:methylated-DNA-[protein]-cysteine S-methyltransferase